MEFLSIRALLLAIFISVVYCVGLAVYRLCFSPLAKFPGPKLAALTLWYEFYYDVIKPGQYTWRIREMHEKYGPIVRINPYEIHINDPDYYDEVYSGPSRRTNKYSWSMNMFGNSESSFATESHELHRIKRANISNFFSKGSVQRVQPAVQLIVDKLVSRLHDAELSGNVINVIDLFSSFTADVISQYSFAKSYNFLDEPDFKPEWHKIMMEVSRNSHVMKQFPWIEPVMRRMPPWLITTLYPQIASVKKMQDLMYEDVTKVKEGMVVGKKHTGQPSIFSDILSSDSVRPQEKTTQYLVDEAQTVIAAGTVTTAHTLSITTFHLLSNPGILAKLQAELATVVSDNETQVTWQQLEKLPFLGAVITEGLRLSYGVIHRLQRISPDIPLQFNEWTIPVNTPVSMSSPFIHDNPTIFPSPRTFNPDRWLAASDVRLEKYFVPFSKGSRQCLGMNLAYCELYLTLAALFAPGRFSFKLFETDITDVETPHDFFNPCYRLDSKGIRVTVLGGANLKR